MRLSKWQRAKVATSTSAEKASIRKAARVLMDAGFLTPTKCLFIYRHYK